MGKKKMTGRGRLVAWVREQRAKSESSLAADMAAGWVWSMTRFAITVGVSRQVVRHWMMGHARPSAPHQRNLEAATLGEVPAKLWVVNNSSA